ncbi:MAG: type II toxin-antitoxin system VapB family antitoxin [Sporichthyaceae bacterium]
MTKRLIDVDDQKLAEVRQILGTTTLKATVNEALEEVLALHRRRAALLAERDARPDALADPEERRAAWG